MGFSSSNQTCDNINEKNLVEHGIEYSFFFFLVTDKSQHKINKYQDYVDPLLKTVRNSRAKEVTYLHHTQSAPLYFSRDSER